MNLQQACSTVLIVGPPETATLFFQIGGRVKRMGQKERPLIVTITTQYTYDDFVRQDAESKAHPIIISQLGTGIPTDIRQELTKAHEKVHVTYFPSSLPEAVIADRFYMSAIGQPIPTRFWVSYTQLAVNRRLTNAEGYIPKARWKAVDRLLTDDPSRKLLGALCDDYGVTASKTREAISKSLTARLTALGISSGSGDIDTAVALGTRSLSLFHVWKVTN
jgi:hypothetical protein